MSHSYLAILSFYEFSLFIRMVTMPSSLVKLLSIKGFSILIMALSYLLNDFFHLGKKTKHCFQNECKTLNFHAGEACLSWTDEVNDRLDHFYRLCWNNDCEKKKRVAEHSRNYRHLDLPDFSF